MWKSVWYANREDWWKQMRARCCLGMQGRELVLPIPYLHCPIAGAQSSPPTFFLVTSGLQFWTKAFLKVSSICDSWHICTFRRCLLSHVCKCAGGAALLCPDVIAWYTLWLSRRKWHHHLCLPLQEQPKWECKAMKGLPSSAQPRRSRRIPGSVTPARVPGHLYLQQGPGTPDWRNQVTKADPSHHPQSSQYWGFKHFTSQPKFKSRPCPQPSSLHVTNVLQQVSSNLSTPSNWKINGTKGGFRLIHFPFFSLSMKAKPKIKPMWAGWALKVNSAKRHHQTPLRLWSLPEKPFPINKPSPCCAVPGLPYSQQGV